MVPLSFTLRAALLTLSTVALPTLSLPAPIAQRDVALHRSSLDSTWDDTDSWESHAGWFSYNEDEDDDDDEGDEWWEVNSWGEEEEEDDDSYDYSCEEYTNYDEDWDEDENDEGCEWDENDESDWENDDDDDDDPTWEDYYFTNLVIHSPHQTLYSGIGTVYTQDGRVGSCGTSHDDSAFVVALGNDWMHHRYQASECGRQIQVTNKGSRHHVGGEGNTITVTVQDTCASCDAGHVDFSHAAWDALTDGSPPGQVDLEWTWL
ncbi:uncharacterized protein QC761_115525 [Podospora bellae-mahoneyi]|uniref:RlpA-like protein double-psi beta-barrel domain-containing protein n=1 Tax=Podospora bellae-mahoneyi TaxID=2093777 RepID=A0ABR0FZZ2_9PEZI|nr:hypothetical protein QC761_115525 [Podospora bellae-mahoneyi]